MKNTINIIRYTQFAYNLFWLFINKINSDLAADTYLSLPAGTTREQLVELAGQIHDESLELIKGILLLLAGASYYLLVLYNIQISY